MNNTPNGRQHCASVLPYYTGFRIWTRVGTAHIISFLNSFFRKVKQATEQSQVIVSRP